ncbi:MAG: dockerin type I repeat-containing protein, partial [Deltaproteobacteria bacterium]
GNIYVTGYSEGGSIGYDFATIKYVEFLCGDANRDETIDLGDVVYLISYLYKNGPPPDPAVAGDVNGDGIVNLGDVVYLITYLYKGGLPPCSD